MELIVLFLIVISVAFFLLKGKKSVSRGYPYNQQKTLLSAAERSFYGVLCRAAEGRAIVFVKVRVGDVLKTKAGLSASVRQSAFNKIAAKHFDYVLCSPNDLSILSAVELDDSSHNTPKRIERDEFLMEACKAANLTLHRIKAKNSYNIADVRDLLFSDSLSSFAVQNTPEQVGVNRPKPPLEPEIGIDIPAQDAQCPKCGSNLVERTAKKGPKAGSKYLGCENFPRCRFSKNA